MFTVNSPGSVTSLGSSRWTDVGRWETLTDKSSVQHAARMNRLKNRTITKISSSVLFKQANKKKPLVHLRTKCIFIKVLKASTFWKKKYLHKNTSINYSQIIAEILIFKSFGKKTRRVKVSINKCIISFLRNLTLPANPPIAQMKIMERQNAINNTK